MQKLQINCDSQLYLVGYRIDDSNTESSDFFTLYFEDERPIDVDGFPIIFFHPQDMQKALDLSNCGCNHLSIPNALEEYAFIDFAYTVYEIRNENATEYDHFINCINMTRDFLAMLPEENVPSDFKKILRDATCHFTFNTQIDEFFNKYNHKRELLAQSIEWTLGATLLHARFIGRPIIV